MSTITRELAKLFRKITNSEIDAEGNAHVVLSPADSLLINNARIALASLEAEPVAWAHRLINKRNGVVHPWVYGSAEACPSEGDIFNIEVMPLYTVPPAPVSVPAAMEMDDDFDSAFEHGKAVGWNAYRAAMLQSFGNSEQLNSPAIPDGLLTVCADAYQVVGVMADALGIFDDEAVQKVMDNLSQQKLIHSDVLPFSIPSAPHKAVTQALTKGMERYGDAMQELAKREVIPDCSCRTCRPVTFSDSRFVVCPDCGNKRCPHANDHRNACTGSNEPGQEGSAYPAAPQQEADNE
ncbi:hypothetical protein UXP39_12570 [Enterobacter sichuanensis]|uniref:hypothetical protein n=1 Tax=Enterobacter sichuanensis TaxID=2071710 RepID=UPI002FD56D8E